jgi:hypothetical protein
MIAGRCVASITLAMVKVLPVPVAPSSTWLRSPSSTPSTSSAMAVGWSPAGVNSVCMTKRRPPSSLARVSTSGRATGALVLLWGMGDSLREIQLVAFRSGSTPAARILYSRIALSAIVRLTQAR